MADEFAAAGLDVQLLGINKIPSESGIGSFTDSMDLPVVQDSSDLELWSAWDAEWRDVYLVNRDNVHVATFNLVTHDLREASDYAELKGMFEDLAAE